jgi:hypothetical protein
VVIADALGVFAPHDWTDDAGTVLVRRARTNREERREALPGRTQGGEEVVVSILSEGEQYPPRLDGFVTELIAD